jgi:hypothetical protein
MGAALRGEAPGLFEVFVLFDVLGAAHQLEARMLAAVIAGREGLPEHAGDLVRLAVLVVMGDAVDPGSLNLVPGLENIADVGRHL